MKIVTISDTHGKHWQLTQKGLLPDGDIIIHSGDCTPRGSTADIEEFLRWYSDLDYKHKILIAGNHDWGFEREPEYHAELCETYGVTYLNDSGITIKGLKIWGSPVSPEFMSWAFNRARTFAEAQLKKIPEIREHWNKIPEDTDILITHGPAYGYGDQVMMFHSPNSGQHVGCEILLEKINEIKPVLHISGHIHEGRGIYLNGMGGGGITTHVNASTLDESYSMWGEKAFVFDWNDLVDGKVKPHRSYD